MTTTKWVGYVNDWVFRAGVKPTAHILTAEFEETPKQLKPVTGQANWDHIQRACGFKSVFNKSQNPAIFDSWQEVYDYLLKTHTANVKRARTMLDKEEENLKAVIRLEKPC